VPILGEKVGGREKEVDKILKVSARESWYSRNLGAVVITARWKERGEPVELCVSVNDEKCRGLGLRSLLETAAVS
jgi:hypothetical protein